MPGELEDDLEALAQRLAVSARNIRIQREPKDARNLLLRELVIELRNVVGYLEQAKLACARVGEVAQAILAWEQPRTQFVGRLMDEFSRELRGLIERLEVELDGRGSRGGGRGGGEATTGRPVGRPRLP